MRNSENEPDHGKNKAEIFSLLFLSIVASISVGLVCHNGFAALATWCILVFISMEFAALKDKLEELSKKKE